jgi:UDP-sugar transporter A1/2/3|tara:strand:- start:782 stop:1879 length:1098 start_codon:yes stop_codon:yes gene_type:complete
VKPEADATAALRPRRPHPRTMAVSTRRSSSARATRDSAAATGGFVFCVLLALQYALQPFLNGRCLSPEVNKLSLVLGVEVAKIAIAVGLMCVEGRGSWERTFTGWTPYAASLSVLPSVVYAVQNYLLVVGASLLDGVTFNCLNQSKLISTAACVYVVFGVRQSRIQMLALAGLLLATVLLQEGGKEGKGGGETGTDASTDRSINNQSANQSFGVAAVLAASALSGVASAATQFSLQKLGRTSTALTVEMACAAIPCILLAHFVSLEDSSSAEEFGRALFSGWSAKTFAPVASSALGGIFVGQITKRLGGVAKGFSIVGGLVLTGFAQGMVGNRPISAKHVTALAVVVACTYAHGTYPPAKKKKKE